MENLLFFDSIFGLNIPQSILGIFLGIGLSAAAGFRVFVPLFALSLGTHLGWIPLSESFQWVGDTAALITLGIATIAEILAYYVPMVDNALDTISVPLAGIAGTFLMGSQLVDMPEVLTWGLAIIAGGGTAAAISGASAATRAVSTTTTAGIGNHLVNTTETGASIFFSVFSFIIPVIIFILVVVILIGLYKFLKLIKNYFKEQKEITVSPQHNSL